MFGINNVMSNDKICSIQNLNNQPGKAIFVIKMKPGYAEYLSTMYKKHMTYFKDKLFLTPTEKLIIINIPSKTRETQQLKTSILQYNNKQLNTMYDIFTRFANYGLAIEGCINAEGIKKRPDDGTNLAYLISDNHKLPYIISSEKFKKYSQGVNVQHYIPGISLVEHGTATVNVNYMKKFVFNGITHPGSELVIDYDAKKFKFKEGSVDFKDYDNNGKGNFKFVNGTKWLDLHNILVVAIDNDNNILIIYHSRIDYFNLTLLLQLLHVKDAMILCEGKVHLIWKEAGVLNTYNKTDFIGNPMDNAVNVIFFSE
jgi:hypothetical protein